ncbi:small glutamine-rich tetratricopeptide repeat-containing protein alpha [Strongylocentrotus purpuratus]|uniref:SGTA homodimerisation domain-containing protein n=1 Tax=Strongylocentrotus purpuratus TaxID=7668 RepID=A0A7M7RBY6_STRPU|nr:small glutamine-rich tetratricopeptide repeat-containing protein alpha [Strongylocentrotus purpuratus]|eukprot:XP_003723521.1 PREDICTED: small glutamine-rich tetratricopeptide repeat-containing protein alpha isoform X2 [Strongylocentrotus purpuratus]
MSIQNRLVFAIVEFLDQQVRSNAVSGEALESLEVGLQCLQTAYGISLDDPALTSQKTERSLLEIFTSAVGGQQPDVTQVAQSSIGACSAAPGPEISEADKARAEKLKNEGNELMKKEQYNKAIEVYTQAINLNSQKSVYYSNRAAAYSKVENHEKALEDCQKAVSIDPTYSKAYGRMGLAYSSMNEFQKACEAYTRAVDLEPGNSSYRANLEIAEQKLKGASLGGGGVPNMAGINPSLGGMDMSQLLQNPAIMNAATSFLQNPQMQQMMHSFMGQAMQPGEQSDQDGGGGGGGGMANLLSVGQQIASQIQQTNPQLVEQVRQMRNSRADPNGTNNNQEETDSNNPDQPPPPPSSSS